MPSVTGNWSGAVTGSAGYVVPPPAARCLQIAIANSGSAGNGLVAFAGWRQPAGYTTTVAVGDDAGNVWEPLGPPAGTSGPGGSTRSAIWFCASPRAAANVYVSPTGYYTSLACDVIEISGLSPWMTLTGIQAKYANAATALGAMSLPAPPASALLLTCCTSDLNTAAITLAAGGWTALAAVTASNGSDHTQDITLTPAYQVTSGAVTATWTSAASQDLSGVLTGVLVTGTAPVAPSQNWPLVRFQSAFGAGASTPWDMVVWTDLTSRYLGMQGQRGKQYELDVLQAGTVGYTLRNNDGALTPQYAGGLYNMGTSGWTGTGCLLYPSAAYSWLGTPSMLITPDGVTGTVYAQSALTPVTAGQSYSAIAMIYSPQGWGTVNAAIRWFDNTSTFISTSSGSSVSVAAGAWTQITVSGVTAPGGAAYGTVVPTFTGTPTAGTMFWVSQAPLLDRNGLVLNSNWNFQPGPAVYTPERLLVTWPPPPSANARTYSVTRGFMERWPQSLTSSRYQVTNAVGTDVWSILTTLMDNVARAELKADQPYALWPCGDPAGSPHGSNVAGTAAGQLQVVTSKYGNGAATQAFGASASYLAGVQGATCWQQATVPTPNTQGSCLYYSDPMLPPLAAGITVEAWCLLTASEPTGTLNLITIAQPRGTSAVLYITQSNGHMLLDVYDASTRAKTTTTISTNNWLVANWVHVALTLTTSAWQVYVNGGGFGSPSGACNLAATGYWLEFGGTADRLATGGFGNISLALLAVFPRVLTQVRIVSHFWGALVAFYGDDDAATRMDRLLGDANSAYPRLMPAGGGTMAGAVDTGGQAVAQNVTNIAQSDSGLLMVNGAGYLSYQQRASMWNLPVLWTLGELTGSGETPYLADITTDFDPAQVFDDVTLTQLASPAVPGGAATGVTVAVSSPAAMGQYGDQTLQQTIYLSDTGGITDLANWIVQTSGNPANRIAQVTLDPSANSGLWPAALSIETGQVVTLNRRLQGTQLVISAQFMVMSVAHRTTPGSWNTVISCVPYYGSVLTADDPVRGLLNGTNRMGF